MRIGKGFDVHRFVDGDSLMLGGVEIPYSKSLLGHSDSDVLLHAICDALLGALALGDIGKLFPDTDAKYKNISSLKLLKSVFQDVSKLGYEIGNLDTLIIAEEPKISPYREAMREKIAEILSTSIKNISVKATTTEKLGFTGRKEGIAVEAVVLLKKKGEN